ncbi:MAG: lipoyl domain-containing protein [Leptospiraceae bacterium]|jgi:pyruvate/2-oxoglutarate dehydrogenase complex dihydrolipoamide acyltransferase (E2) component|nr:lipoyl domain-containing protein [Leptospiraceae bacterium]
MLQEKKHIPLLVPDIGDAEKIELVQWNIQEGELVEEGSELCELVTSKATFPLESPFKGRIIKILKGAGSTVKVGEELAIIEVS